MEVGKKQWGPDTPELSSNPLVYRGAGLRLGTPTSSRLYEASKLPRVQGTKTPGTPYLKSVFLTEPVAHPLPWSRDWTDLGCNSTDPWSCASQTPGPAPPGTSPSPFVGFEGATGQNPATSAGGIPSWSHPPAAWSTASWDCSVGPSGATYWDNGLSGEARADYKMSWGGSAGSDYTTTWNTGLQECSIPFEGRQSPAFTTPSKSSQQSDRATLTRYSKTNHRGKRLQTAEEVKPNGLGLGLDALGVGSG